MKKNTKGKTTKPPVDRESVRVLAIELGARETARRLGLKEGTVLSWASRYKWNLPSQRNVGRPAISAIELQSKPGDVLLATHKDLEERTKSGLARATARAAEAAATAPEPLQVSSTAHLRDLAASAARIFGWDTKQPQTQINQLCITREQLQQIRAAREQVDARESPSDTPGCQ